MQHGIKPLVRGFPGDSDSEEPTCNVVKPRFDPWVRKIPWRRKQKHTRVFLTGKFHGQRNLVGYSPCGCKDLGMTEQPTHRELRFHMLGGS